MYVLINKKSQYTKIIKYLSYNPRSKLFTQFCKLSTESSSYLPNELKVNLFEGWVSCSRKLQIEVGQRRVRCFQYYFFSALTQTNKHLRRKQCKILYLSLRVWLHGLKRRTMSCAPLKFLPLIYLWQHLFSFFRHQWWSHLPVAKAKSLDKLK